MEVTQLDFRHHSSEKWLVFGRSWSTFYTILLGVDGIHPRRPNTKISLDCWRVLWVLFKKKSSVLFQTFVQTPCANFDQVKHGIEISLQKNRFSLSLLYHYACFCSVERGDSNNEVTSIVWLGKNICDFHRKQWSIGRKYEKIIACLLAVSQKPQFNI